MLQMLNPLRGSLRICCYKPKATQRQFSSKHHKHPESSDFNFGEFMKLVQLKDYEKYRVPKLPIVLCHGLFGFDKVWMFDYWRGIQKDLEEIGCKVVITRVPPTSPIEVRAEYLQAAVDYLIKPEEELGKSRDVEMKHVKYQALKRNIAWDDSIPLKKVHLVGHSMGGLDSRYYVSQLGGNKHAVSLLTIGTPHRGSGIADWLQSEDSILIKIGLEQALKIMGVEIGAFRQLTTQFCEQDFNKKILNHPDVHYFSIAGGAKPVSKLSSLRPFYNKLLELEGENDGLVSIKSAKWGTFLGTIEADHMEQINWNWLKDHKSIYRNIASFLARVEDKLLLHPNDNKD